MQFHIAPNKNYNLLDSFDKLHMFKLIYSNLLLLNIKCQISSILYNMLTNNGMQLRHRYRKMNSAYSALLLLLTGFHTFLTLCIRRV